MDLIAILFFVLCSYSEQYSLHLAYAFFKEEFSGILTFYIERNICADSIIL